MSNPMSITQYAQFCAPTALATLLGVSRLEAAKYLTAEGCNCGNGATRDWSRVMKDLGGELINDLETDEDVARYDDALERYFDGKRRTPPKPSLRRPTVAEVLRRYPEGLYVITTTRHTLVARDGKVISDTMDTKSQRARVSFMHRFPADMEVGLPEADARELRVAHAQTKAAKARAKRRREARRDTSFSSLFRL